VNYSQDNYTQLILPLPFTLDDYTQTEKIVNEAAARIAQEKFEYNFTKGAGWFLKLVTYAFRIPLTHQGDGFQKTTITQNRTGVLITFVRETSDRGREYATWILPWGDPDINKLRSAFHNRKLQWKKSKYD